MQSGNIHQQLNGLSFLHLCCKTWNTESNFVVKKEAANHYYANVNYAAEEDRLFMDEEMRKVGQHKLVLHFLYWGK